MESRAILSLLNIAAFCGSIISIGSSSSGGSQSGSGSSGSDPVGTHTIRQLTTVQRKDYLHYAVAEEVEPGSAIADIVTDAGLYTLGLDVLRTLRFKFLNQLGSSGLAIDEMTGYIRNSRRLDREALCGQEDVCKIRLDVAILPMTYFRIVKVTIDILDENDNTPR